MIDPAYILAILLAHPSWADRLVSPDMRARALEPVADAIAEVAETRAEASRLIADGMHESGNFSLSVVLRGCDGMSARACDFRTSRGAWQLKERSCPEAHAHRAGSTDSIRAEARCAVSLMRGYLRDCRAHGATPVHAMFAALALGHCGSWLGSGARVETAKRIEIELARAEAR